MKNLLVLGLLSTIYACSHPIEIVGEGDVLSATGTRNCFLEDFQAKKENCTKNIVQGAYNETYYAVPRTGWEFDRWINYCADVVNNECAFTIPADAVQKNWGTTVPSLVAVFTQTPVVPPEPPPSFPSVDQDGNVSFATAKAVGDQSVTNGTISSSRDADYFKFTAGETAYYSVAVEFSIPHVSLYWYNDDANATIVGESRTSGATKQIIEGKRLEKGKTYYLDVQAISQQEMQNYKLTISRGEVIPVGPVLITIEPDDYPAGTDISNPVPGVSLSAPYYGGSAAVLSVGSAEPTGERVFGTSVATSLVLHGGGLDNIFVAIDNCVNGSEPGIEGSSICRYEGSFLVVTFDTPTDFVSISACVGSDAAILSAYSADGNRLEWVAKTRANPQDSCLIDLQIARTQNDIAYIAAYLEHTGGYLDTLQFNGAPAQ